MKKRNTFTDIEKVKATFRERIEKIRTDNGLNQKDFCDKIGITPRQYQAWIHGTFNSASGKTNYTLPSDNTLCDICEAFGVSIDYLYGRTDYLTANNEMISKELLISDKAIENIKANRKHFAMYDYMLVAQHFFSGGKVDRTPQAFEHQNAFSDFLESDYLTDFIVALKELFHSEYRIPVHFVPGGVGWVQNENHINGITPSITLARNSENLSDNMDIIIDNDFLKSVYLNRLETILNDMKQEHDKRDIPS